MRTLTFPNVTPEVWNELKINITKDGGLVLSGDEGAGEAKGIKYSYKYDSASHVLQITEVSRSFYDPSEDVIIAKIHDAVEADINKSH